MMSLKDIENARFMAEVWRMNHERNQKLELEKKKNKEKFKEIDDAVQE